MSQSAVGPPSGRRPSLDVGLAVAGGLTCVMALYHFTLPYVWGWGEDLLKAPMLHWALFMLNPSFSYLLLAGGAVTIAIALGPTSRDRTGRWVLVGMCGYWLFNAVYQITNPMPMPARLAPLRWCLFGFAAAVALLYVVSLLRGARGAAVPSSARPVALPG